MRADFLWQPQHHDELDRKVYIYCHYLIRKPAMHAKFVVEEVDRRKFLGLQLPFQSLAQLLSFLIFTGMGILLIWLLVYCFAPGTFSCIIIVGALAGALPSVYMALPSQLTIDCEPEGHAYWYAEVSTWLVFFGYPNREKHADGETFTTRLGPLLSWKENRITILTGERAGKTVLIVKGTGQIITMLEKKLSRPALKS